MAEVTSPKVPSKEWIEDVVKEARKAQEFYATNPERYREYLNEIERKGKEVIPDDMPIEERMVQMEVNMKALTDYDPSLIPGFDMERMMKSMAFVNKVKDRFEVSKPEAYQQFLEAWKSEQVIQDPVDGMWNRIHTQMETILAGDPDLLEELDSLAPPEKKAN